MSDAPAGHGQQQEQCSRRVRTPARLRRVHLAGRRSGCRGHSVPRDVGGGEHLPGRGGHAVQVVGGVAVELGPSLSESVSAGDENADRPVDDAQVREPGDAGAGGGRDRLGR